MAYPRIHDIIIARLTKNAVLAYALMEYSRNVVEIDHMEENIPVEAQNNVVKAAVLGYVATVHPVND
jgi:hypothetical protein